MKRLILSVGTVLAAALLILYLPEQPTLPGSEPLFGEAQVSVLLLLHAPGLRP